MRLRTVAIAAGIVVLLLVLAVVGLLRLGSPAMVKYTVRGIDVSHHQGLIDWRRVAATHVRFAYLKASEGADWRDPSFAPNLAGARSNAIAAGAYHYFTFCAPGGAQATNFLDMAEPEATNLPPAVDLEYVGNCATRPSREAFSRELRAFLHIVEARYRTLPVLYSTRTFYDSYLSAAEFARYPLWIRDFTNTDIGPARHTVLFRQFADNGSIAGIRRPADEDLFMGSKEDFATLIAQRRTGLHPLDEHR